MGSTSKKKFQVRLHGENFLMPHENGKLVKHGFYTTRWVEAEDANAAESAAVELVRDDPSLIGSVRNPREDSPMIYCEGIIELKSFEGVNPPGKGFTFYCVV